jgi:coatomer protein complex subunit gamma
MVQGVERFFKAAIVDRNSSISSAALVSSYHLFPQARDVIKRWSNEAQEAIQAKPSSSSLYSPAAWGGGGASTTAYQAVQSNSYATQYHALGLLYLIRQSDRMAVTKLIQQLSGGKNSLGSASVLRSPYAICMIIRYAAKVMAEDPK